MVGVAREVKFANQRERHGLAGKRDVKDLGPFALAAKSPNS